MTRDPSTQRYAAQNRKARYDYEIGDSLEAGLVLTGSEVKSLRLGRCSIAEAFAAERDGDFWLMNAHFPEYESANRENHAPRRARKLLLKRREAKRLIGATERDGMTPNARSRWRAARTASTNAPASRNGTGSANEGAC